MWVDGKSDGSGGGSLASLYNFTNSTNNSIGSSTQTKTVNATGSGMILVSLVLNYTNSGYFIIKKNGNQLLYETTKKTYWITVPIQNGDTVEIKSNSSASTSWYRVVYS